MHKYLKTIGLGGVDKATLDRILMDVELNYDRKRVVELDNHRVFAEISREFGYDCGLTICGEYDEENVFHMEYYFPYFAGSQVSTNEDLIVERHAGKESYAGACDDPRLGITLIFYVINAVDFLNIKQAGLLKERKSALTLSALADSGKIMLPTARRKSAKEEEKLRIQRGNLISAAKNGDQEAMESLTMEDIDIYTMLSRRVQKEDIYSIVDTCFMPHGIECDQYAVIGEITALNTTTNEFTGEKIIQMSLMTNEMPLDVCINEKDLYGVPEVGRRFKGVVWLQGMIHF